MTALHATNGSFPSGSQLANRRIPFLGVAMIDESRLGELMLSWHEHREKGRPVAPEELCADCPELLLALRARIDAVHAMGGFMASTADQRAGGLGSTLLPDAGGGEASAHASLGSASRYGLVRFHAKGGLGEVYVAQDVELGREVALKRMQPRHADHPESRRRFQREAEITARLAHPGIVPVHGLVHDADGRPCYAMRFIEGESLADAIERLHEAQQGVDYNGLPFRQLLQKLVTVCNTLAYAHSKGVIHRDVKPHNVMLGQYGETLLVDWGLAKASSDGATAPVEHAQAKGPTPAVVGDSSLTQQGRAMGTLAFMSPEQATGKWDEVGPASDVYSLGATLYVLLTGKLAFEATEYGHVMASVQQGRFIPPHARCPNVPPALNAVCLKAMAQRQEDRYASPLDLARELERWLADEPIDALPDGMRSRMRRWTRRHRTLVAAAAAVVVAACILLTGAVALLSAAYEREHQAKLAEAQERTKAIHESAEAEHQRRRAETNASEALRAYENEREAKLAEAKERAEAERQRNRAVNNANEAVRQLRRAHFYLDRSLNLAAIGRDLLAQPLRQDYTIFVDIRRGEENVSRGVIAQAAKDNANFTLALRSDRDCYAAIWQVTAEGAIKRVMPNRGEDATLVKAGMPVRVPEAEGVEFERRSTAGADYFYVLTSDKPWKAPTGERAGLFVGYPTEALKSKLRQGIAEAMAWDGAGAPTHAIAEDIVIIDVRRAAGTAGLEGRKG